MCELDPIRCSLKELAMSEVLTTIGRNVRNVVRFVSVWLFFNYHHN